ncbi:uncharacterized protein F4807DRAFT_416990 [Annulohypoxylon truncatum]|uniref:uncharacterized protein n=1 Tax=Annulohypoxylon truncatum TaxID=327061 RepID=UPI0020073A2D|nr:uncharacterized protein F4807DRAFT_416990 [Annulohypoxylon truncatum]KAI1211943.1 hypothetical protein F4807DRAFT_416990 [Annulohypoxylon truncatum]
MDLAPTSISKQRARTQRDSFRMDKLPMEIVQNIFFRIDNFDTLRSAILTCRHLHAAFTSRERSIVTQVLVNQIGWDVLPEAIVVDESFRLEAYNSSLGTYDSQKAEEFSKKHLSHRMTSLSEPARWNLAEALPLVRLHKVVKFLAKQIADYICGPRYVRQGQLMYRLPFEPCEPMPSSEGLYRIQRALYRFQLYWNMFGLSEAGAGLATRRYAYFRIFSVWENEQLACAQHHLLRIIRKPVDMDPFAHHDAFECYLSSSLSESGSEFSQHALSQGLEYIYEIATSETFADARKLLKNIFSSLAEPSLAPIPNNLFESLRRCSPPVDFGRPFRELDEEDRNHLVENPYCNDNHCSYMSELLEATYDLAYTLDDNGGELDERGTCSEEGYAFWDWYYPH